MAKDLKTQVMKHIERGGTEFVKDGGLSYTDSVLHRVERDDIMFDAKGACVTLCTIIQALLQEYGKLVAQLEEAGTKIVEVGPTEKE